MAYKITAILQKSLAFITIKKQVSRILEQALTQENEIFDTI